MELKELFKLYRRWFWLLIAGLVLGMASGFLASQIQAPVYEASTRILITRSRQDGGADMLSLSDQELVVTYQQLLKTRPVLDETEKRLDVEIDPDNVKVDVILDTQIIQIKIRDKDPEHAVEIANTMVQILIEQNESLHAGRYSIYEENLNSQIADIQVQIDNLQGQITQINEASVAAQTELVNQQITELQGEISQLENDISNFPSLLSEVNRARLSEKQTQLDQLRSLLYLYRQIQSNLTFIGQPVQGEATSADPRLSSLQATLSLYQQLYLDLLNNLTAAKLARVQSTPTVSQIEAAVIPKRPLRPIPVLYTALSGMIGMFIVAVAILVIEYFDDTLKSPQKIEQVLGIPVLGEISEAASAPKSTKSNGIEQVSSAVLNAFGILRINLSRLIKQKSLKTILVTSPTLGDGKTTIAVNLAKAFAEAGKKVVLLDADLYHPALHSRFGLEVQNGLSDILTKNLDWQDVALDVDGISVITGGTPSLATSVSLESEGMTRLLSHLQKAANVVIIDGPPLFIVDSQILASKVGGILLVIRQGSTVIGSARAMLNQLHLLDVTVLGAVLNCAPRAASDSAEYYRRIPEEKLVDRVENVEAS